MKEPITAHLTALLGAEGGAQALADAMELDADTLQAKLDGRTEWTWSEALNAAELCGCRLSEFVGGGR